METVEIPPADGAPAPEDAPVRDRPFPRNRDVDKAAAEMAEKTVLPLPPGRKITWDQMQQYFSLLTPEMWSHTNVYLYRLKPRIIRQLRDPDAPKYIDVVGRAFDLEYVIERHGGGSYMIECIDTSPQKRNSNQLFRCFFEIDEVRHEPKLNYEELDVTHRDNISYIQVLQHRGILDNKGRPVSTQQQTPIPAAGMNADVIKEILGFVTTLNAGQQQALREKISSDQNSLGKSVGDILLEQMKQSDPTKQVAMLAGLVTALKEIVATSKPNDASGIYDKVISMQSEHNKTVLALIERIVDRDRERNDEGSDKKDEFERLDKVLGFAEKLASLHGSGGKRTGWDIGLDYARELGGPLVQALTGLWGMRGRPAGAAAAAGAAPPVPAAFDPYSNPDALRAHSKMAAQQAPPPMMPNGAPPAGGELSQLIAQYGNLVLNALNNGVRGCDFADDLSGLFGNATHAAIANYGEETLVRTMMTIRELSLFGEVRLRTFAHEFCHYDEILEAEQNEEAEAAGASA